MGYGAIHPFVIWKSSARILYHCTHVESPVAQRVAAGAGRFHRGNLPRALGLSRAGLVPCLSVLRGGTAAGREHHAWLMRPPAPQAHRHRARQSCPDAASWAVLAYYRNYLWQPLLEIVPFIVLASETIKFSKLLPKQIFNPVNSRACNCLKQIGMCITLKSLLL